MAESTRVKGTLRGVKALGLTAFRADPFRASGVAATALAESLSRPLYAVAIGWITDAVVESQADLALKAVVVYGLLSLLSGLSGTFNFTLRMHVREKTMHLLDRRVMELAAGAPGLEHFERPEYADKIEVLRNQRQMLAGVPDSLVWNGAALAQIAMTSVILARLHPLLLLLPFFAVPSAWMAFRTSRGLEDLREELAERGRVRIHLFKLGTTARPAKEVRVFGLQRELVEHRDRIWEEIDGKTLSVSLRYQAKAALAWAVFAAGYVAALVLVVRNAVAGRSSVGDVVVAFTLAGQVRQQVQQFSNTLQWFVQTLKAAERYAWLEGHWQRALESVRPKERAPVPERLTDGIRLDRVSFVYPGTDRPVLADVNLHIPAGSIVAIVGDNGAGKSTLVKLLARYYDPTEGTILVDGVDVRNFDIGEWRSRLSAGFQDYAKFELIARESVGVGNLPRAEEDDEVVAALGRASSDALVADLPDGLGTMLGRSFEGGVELSGGQWQKLALGRAMMRERPLLLLLDEPTASLDPQTEHDLFDRYSAAARAAAHATGGITVLVSHRFSTVRMADLILVVDGHTIAEWGSHAELVGRGGLYAELYEMQASSYR